MKQFVGTNLLNLEVGKRVVVYFSDGEETFFRQTNTPVVSYFLAPGVVIIRTEDEEFSTVSDSEIYNIGAEKPIVYFTTAGDVDLGRCVHFIDEYGRESLTVNPVVYKYGDGSTRFETKDCLFIKIPA